MKKTKVAIIVLFIIVAISTIVHATNEIVKLNGEDEVKAEEEQIITIEISNNEEIGVIEGVISKDSNIKDLKVSPSYNGWTATYNETTGQFNAFKAEGAKSGGVLQITYKLNQNAQQGVLTLKNVELTTIIYENIKIENNISKTIKKVNEPNKTNTTQENTVQENTTRTNTTRTNTTASKKQTQVEDRRCRR